MARSNVSQLFVRMLNGPPTPEVDAERVLQQLPPDYRRAYDRMRYLRSAWAVAKHLLPIAAMNLIPGLAKLPEDPDWMAPRRKKAGFQPMKLIQNLGTGSITADGHVRRGALDLIPEIKPADMNYGRDEAIRAAAKLHKNKNKKRATTPTKKLSTKPNKNNKTEKMTKPRQKPQRNSRPPVTSGQVVRAGPKVQYQLQPNDGVVVQLKSVTNITTVTTTGIASPGYFLGDGAGTGSVVSIDTVLGKLATFYGMYDWSSFQWLLLEYLPNVAYDATGYIGIAYDPDPRSDVASSITDVSRHTKAVTGDVKSPLRLLINRNDMREHGSGIEWYTTNDNADLEWRGPGVVQIYAATNQVTSATVLGQLRMTGLVALKGINEA